MTHIVAVVFLNSYYGKKTQKDRPRDTPGKRTQKDRPRDTPVTHRVSFCEVPVSAVVYVGLQAD